MSSPLHQPHPLQRLIDVVHQADQFKQQQFATMWPELADALVGLIEGTTEHDAPRAWHAKPTREPITAEQSMYLYGVVYQQGDKVLHPDEVTVVLNPITGQPQGYIVHDTPG